MSFNWNKSCQVTFNQFNQKLTQAPVLAYPAFGLSVKQFVLQTNASSTGIGAVLKQDRQVVAYTSRTLSSTERNYNVIQQEAWPLFLPSNKSDTISLVASSSCSLTTLPYSDFQVKKWRAF